MAHMVMMQHSGPGWTRGGSYGLPRMNQQGLLSWMYANLDDADLEQWIVQNLVKVFAHELLTAQL